MLFDINKHQGENLFEVFYYVIYIMSLL